MSTLARAEAALSRVADPCSVGLGSPMSILELGLVIRLEADEDRVVLVLRSTGPGCLMMPHIMSGAHEALTGAGFTDVDIRHDPTAEWRESDRRAPRPDPAATLPVAVRPRQWMERQS